MSQKGFALFLPLISILFVITVGIGGYYFIRTNPIKGLTQSPNQLGSKCTKISEYAIQHKNLTKVVSCEEKEFTVDGQKVYLVSISYGEPQDCPSGCIQPYYTAIVDKDKVTDYGNLREDFLDIAINTKVSKLCNSKQPYELTLIKNDQGEFRWKVMFSNQASRLCRLSGYATVNGGAEAFDLTNLNAEIQEIDCDNPETLDEICLKIPDVAYNCGVEEKKKEACLYLKGLSNGINCDDNIVARRKCMEINGDSSGKCNDEIINKNYCFKSKAEVEENLKICDLITNDVDLLDGCYARLAITLKDPSICFKRELSDFWRQVCY